MGVPQKRERVFFIGHKNEFKLPKLKLEFNEKPIVFGEFVELNANRVNLSKSYTENGMIQIKGKTQKLKVEILLDLCIKQAQMM